MIRKSLSGDQVGVAVDVAVDIAVVVDVAGVVEHQMWKTRQEEIDWTWGQDLWHEYCD